MIDPLVSLAYSVYTNKGIYALLLGSGISRSAGIPTGWEVLKDLIVKLSQLYNEKIDSDPEKWFFDKFGKSPRYDEILNEIAFSPTERRNLLKSYFEPNEEEIESGLKQPTKAHKAIASMMEKGLIRIVLTTNFDRLLEKALEEKGINPHVISSPDAIEGSLPIPHISNCIVKLHGDYLDSRIKNTPSELDHYDEKINNFLDRIIDEFGLIICGWSGDWDEALRIRILRCKNHRFTTYWAARWKLSGVANNIATNRRAQIVKIKDADSFFHELYEKIDAMSQLSIIHPLSKQIAESKTKKYISSPLFRIKLHDMVLREANSVYNWIVESGDLLIGDRQKKLEGKLDQYNNKCEILKTIYRVGCYWGDKEHANIWCSGLEMISDIESVEFEKKLILYSNDIRLYPSLLLLYSAGISSLAVGNYHNLYKIFYEINIKHNDKEFPLGYMVNCNRILTPHDAKKIPGYEKNYTPFSEYLFDLLKNDYKILYPNVDKFEKLFDVFEYLLSLTCCDISAGLKRSLRFHHGRFAWKTSHYGQEFFNGLMDYFKEKGKYRILEAGFFKSDKDIFSGLNKNLLQSIYDKHY